MSFCTATVMFASTGGCKVNFRENSFTALLEVCHGYGRGLRDLVNRYNPNVSTNNFPVILGRDGTGAEARDRLGTALTVVPLQAS